MQSFAHMGAFFCIVNLIREGFGRSVWGPSGGAGENAPRGLNKKNSSGRENSACVRPALYIEVRTLSALRNAEVRTLSAVQPRHARSALSECRRFAPAL
jgi:hypothetical protein